MSILGFIADFHSPKSLYQQHQKLHIEELIVQLDELPQPEQLIIMLSGRPERQ